MNDLYDLVSNGESKTLEFKEQLPSNKQLVKSIISFANTSGGMLIIGVSDKRQIVGISGDIFALKDKISNAIYDNCYPSVFFDIYTQNYKGKTLLVIRVYKGKNPPYRLKSDENVYIRVGATTKVADDFVIADLQRQRLNVSFDEESDLSVDFAKLDLSPLQKAFKEINKELNQEKMLNLKLINKEGDKLYATRGLMILLGLYENVVIKCSRFKGVSVGEFIDKKEYSNDLINQVQSTLNFIKNHINLKANFKDLKRIDNYEIPITAIREALVNAVVHRDYSKAGRDIKVGIYDDGINIVSPGAFPNGINMSEIICGRSEIRNKVIARVFKELGYIEQWGSGVARFINECKNFGLKSPEIKESGDFVDVMFYRQSDVLRTNTNEYERIRTNTNESANESANEYERMKGLILDYLKINDIISRSIVCKITNVKNTKAYETLNKMLNDGLLLKQGNGKNTYYVLNDN